MVAMTTRAPGEDLSRPRGGVIGAPWIRRLYDNQHYLTVSFKRKRAL